MHGLTNPSATYAELLAQVQPRSITNEDEAEQIQALIDCLIDQSTLTEEEEDFLSLLGDLLLAWEGDRYDLQAPTPQAMVQALLEANGRTQQDLVGSVFATKSVASEVLRGKRRLTYDHVERLARYFRVTPSLFFPPAPAAVA
jgi:HTH-type transcriptional regulator/antitoxin HigA